MDPEVEEWVPLSLTLVEYPKGDVVGKVLAVMSLAPMMLAILHGGFFILIRDCHSLFFGIGVILNFIANYLLKNYIKELRPVPRHQSGCNNQFNVYGMPSTHAQFMSFYLFYMVLFVFIRLPMTSDQHQKLLKMLGLSALGALSVVVVISRVYLWYHTVEQVFYGFLLGLLFAYAWFWLLDTFICGWFPWLSSTRIGKFFGLKDLSTIPNFWKHFDKEICKKQSNGRKKDR